MGLSQSKLLSQALDKACRDYESSGKNGFSETLLDREVLDLARRFWASIPKNFRRKIGRNIDGRHQRNPKKFLRNSHDVNITVPPAFLASINRWHGNPISFFTEGSFHLGSAESPLGQLYIYLKNLEGRMEKDVLRSRLIKVLYYRLKNRLCINNVRANDVEIVTQITSKAGIMSVDLEEVKNTISKWIKEGMRLDLLCKDISKSDSSENKHLGVLFCLPHDANDKFIHSSRFNGESRSKEIIHLQERGILRVERKESIDALASKIFGALWQNVESSIQDIASVSDSNWAMQRTQAFQLQITSEPGSDGLNATNSGYVPSPDAYSSTPESIVINSSVNPPPRSNFLAENDRPRERKPGMTCAQNKADSTHTSEMSHHSSSRAHEAPHLLARDAAHPESSNFGPGTQNNRSSQSHDLYNRDLTGSQNRPNTNSSAIHSAVTASIESLSSSMRSEAESSNDLDGEINQVLRSIGGAQYAPFQDGQVLTGPGTSYNLHEGGQELMGGVPHCLPFQDGQDLTGPGISYNLHEGGQEMVGGVPHYLPFQDGQVLTGPGTSYNLHEGGQEMVGGVPHCLPFQDGQDLTGPGISYNLHEGGQEMVGGVPHYLPFQDGQVLTGPGSSYNLHEGGQELMGGVPHCLPFQDGQDLTGPRTSYNLHEGGQEMRELSHYLPVPNGQAMWGIERTMNLDSTADQNPTLQTTSITVPSIPAGSDESRNNHQSSFSWPISAT